MIAEEKILKFGLQADITTPHHRCSLNSSTNTTSKMYLFLILRHQLWIHKGIGDCQTDENK